MENVVSKEELDSLSKIQGEVRGLAFKGDADFVLHELGEEGLLKLESEMANQGFPVKYRNVKPMNFYPLSMDAISFLTMKRLFHFEDKKIQELGSYLARVSLVLKLFMKYFVSLETVAQKAPEMWRNHYTVGNLTIASIDEEKREITLRLENFNPHELYCLIFQGYFCNVIQMIVGKKPVSEETKCMFKGDPYHEFVIRW